MERNDILKYLHKVFEIETSLYQQKKILDQLRYAKNNVRIGEYKEIAEIKPKKFGADIWWCILVHVLWFWFMIVVRDMDGKFNDTINEAILKVSSFVDGISDVFVAMGFDRDIALLIIAIFLPCVFDIIIFSRSFCKHGRYVHKVRDYNNYVAQHNNQVTGLREAETGRLICKIQQAEKYYTETQNVLQKVYGMGIVYPKYQNLVAVGMFCEYFDSGRCTTLEGHEGAYNIYENEIRQNLIIAKLEDIVRKLDSIERNQYFLYQAIQDSNKTVKRVSSELLSKIDSIDQNQDLIAYYSRIAARNTDFLAWERVFPAR